MELFPGKTGAKTWLLHNIFQKWHGQKISLEIKKYIFIYQVSAFGFLLLLCFSGVFDPPPPREIQVSQYIVSVKSPSPSHHKSYYTPPPPPPPPQTLWGYTVFACRSVRPFIRDTLFPNILEMLGRIVINFCRHTDFNKVYLQKKK